MGIAARNKRTRHIGRTWRTVNPRTGATEVFTVRIDDQSLYAWERDRAGLAAQGYPDRPPTFATPTYRSWDASADDPMRRPTAADKARVGVFTEGEPLGIWSARDMRGTEIELLVGRRGSEAIGVVNALTAKGQALSQRPPPVPLSRIAAEVLCATSLWQKAGFGPTTQCTSAEVARLFEFAVEEAGMGGR